MKNKLYIAISIFLMTGCATSSLDPMPEAHYEEKSFFAGAIRQCFEKEYISPQLYADTKNAFSYTLTTWSYDQKKLSSMIDDAYAQLNNPDARKCRKVEAMALEMISLTKQHRVDQRQNQEDINNTLKEFKVNKPIYCNTIGTMTICN